MLLESIPFFRQWQILRCAPLRAVFSALPTVISGWIQRSTFSPFSPSKKDQENLTAAEVKEARKKMELLTAMHRKD
jgi:hypothetical protein